MTHHNQTWQRWLDENIRELGTAIFVSRLAISSQLRFDYKQDVSYEESLTDEIQGRTIAFQWVPHSVATYMELRESTCFNFDCELRCAKPGCLCIEGKCVRGDETGNISGNLPDNLVRRLSQLNRDELSS